MHLLSCEHPQRVFNKYLGEYVWVACGKCNSCKNAKAYRWTDALERERYNSRYCLFVTLTFDDLHLPTAGLGFYPDFDVNFRNLFDRNLSIVPNNVSQDSFCIPFKDFIKDYKLSKEDMDLLFGLFHQFGGIPYASGSVLQLFHKRLNKYFHDNVTKSFKNFRYFVVSEYGSTTLRPHFHGIYYTDCREVADRFREAVSVSWKSGIIDCQFVEKSATSYVAQYINKSADLPLFYQTGQFATRYWFSKRPIIGARFRFGSDGTMSQCTKDLQELLDNGSVEIASREKAGSSNYVSVPIDASTQNFLYPKCVSFGTLSDTCRIELYTVSCRFARKCREGFSGFLKDVCVYMHQLYEDFKYSVLSIESEFACFLHEFFYKDWISDDEEKHNRAFNWLRRVYYTSRKFMLNCLNFKLSAKEYFCRIVNFYKNKELWLLKQFYQYQENYDGASDDLVLMYPETLWSDYNMSIKDYFDDVNFPKDCELQIANGKQFAESNKKTHFKNAYLDSLQFKRTYKTLFTHLKNYFYAKKCYETLEAIAA